MLKNNETIRFNLKRLEKLEAQPNPLSKSHSNHKIPNVVEKNLIKLDQLERGSHPRTSEKVLFDKSKIKIEYAKLLMLEKNSYIDRRNFDDCGDDDINTEFDEIILPIDDDIINKKVINIEIINGYQLMNSFPNALLLEGKISNRKDIQLTDTIHPSNTVEKEIITKPDDIWDILNKLDKEIYSDSLDILTTESESNSKSNDLSDSDKKNILDNNGYSNTVCKGCNIKGTMTEDQRSGVIVCSECGMINEEILDYGPEWRQYNNDDNGKDGVSRCGCPSNFFFPKSSQGTIMAGSTNSRLRRKQKWNSMVYKERSLNLVFEYIAQICSKNKIPKIIVDTARTLYKKLSDCKHKTGQNIGKQIIIRGDNRLSIIAACVFKACEMNKNPRSIKEISEFFKLDEKKVTKGIKHFSKIMKNTDDNSLMLDQFDPDTAEDYIRRHSRDPKLRLNKAQTDMAVRISQNCCKMKLAADHNPQSIAAGSILLMVNYNHLNLDRKDIANCFGTSDVTIGKIYNKISPYADALVNNDATDYLIKKFKING